MARVREQLRRRHGAELVALERQQRLPPAALALINPLDDTRRTVLHMVALDLLPSCAEFRESPFLPLTLLTDARLRADRLHR